MTVASSEQSQRVGQISMAGAWVHTDDTEMALSIFEMLGHRGTIDTAELAVRFAERFRKDLGRGYGAMAANRASAAAFRGVGSLGNGAAMRVAPLGAYFAEDPESRLREEVVASASVTHAHPEGKAGAIAVAVAAARASQLRDYPVAKARSELLSAVFDRTPDGETRAGIARAMKLPTDTAPETAARVLGNGSLVTAPDTVPYAGCGSIPREWQDARERYDFEERE